MTTRAMVGAGVAALVIAFAAGRFSVPESDKSQSKTSEVHQKTESEKQDLEASINRARHQEVTVTEIVRPDGTRETTTRKVTDSELHQSSTETRERASSEMATWQQELSRETTRSSSRLDVALLVGPSFSFSSSVGPLVYGIHISRPLLGPITLGLWGMSNRTGGISVGLQF